MHTRTFYHKFKNLCTKLRITILLTTNNVNEEDTTEFLKLMWKSRFVSIVLYFKENQRLWEKDIKRESGFSLTR